MTTEPSESPSESPTAPIPYVGIVVTFVCVLLVGMCLAWAFLAMRAVTGVGGACDSSAAYEVVDSVSRRHLADRHRDPGHADRGARRVRLRMSIGAPALLVPVWALLFTSLGWNFFEFGFTDGNVSFIISGVLFWAMAAPAWIAMWIALKNSILKSLHLEVKQKKRRKTREEKLAEKRAATGPWSAASLAGSLWWWPIYAVLGCGGALFGVAVVRRRVIGLRRQLSGFGAGPHTTVSAAV